MRANLLLLAFALAMSFALAEAMLRIAAPDLGRPDGRLLLITEPPTRDEAGAIRFAPRRSIRMAFLYGDDIEVDVRFGTNNAGVLDDRDYLPRAAAGRAYAFVGDSYAAGAEGDRRWIPALRERLGIEAYALGMSATGVLGFERMLASHARQFPFTDVVIVGISDDLFRPLWRPVVRGDEIRFCREAETDDACAERAPMAHLMRHEISRAGLVARAREIRDRFARSRGVVRSVLRNSRLLMLARTSVLDLAWQASRRPVLEDSRRALARIRHAYPDALIRFVHVPDRHETQSGAYDLDVRALLAGTGIEYLPVLGTCPWSMRHYFPRDNHPNAAGYEALDRCVAGMLGLERPARPR